MPDPASQATVVPDPASQATVVSDPASQATVVPDPASQATVVSDPASQATVVPDPASQATVVPGAPSAEYTGPKQIGDYVILRELGVGGMGTVFEARESSMNRTVALKLLSRQSSSSERGKHRFEQEAWITGRLDHPNIVKVYERGEWENLSYYSMEIVRGGSLADVIENMKRWGRDDSLELEYGTREYIHWAINQVIQTARGLEHAHRHGVVHRDIKPMNLLMDREVGAVKIADFGLAIDEGVTRMTTVGTVLGTLCYMAPEQVLGKSRDFDARTDVYALGVTLYELLTLELPFQEKNQQMYMSAVLTKEVRKPSKLNNRISRDLEVVLGKSLEKRRRDRYASAEAFADDLDNVIHLRPIAAQPSGIWSHTRKWVLRKPVHAALIATVLFAVPTVTYLAQRELQHRQVVRAATIEELLREARWLEERGRHADGLAVASRILDLDRNSRIGLRHLALSRMHQSLRAESEESAERLRAGALDAVDRVIILEPEASWPHALKAFMLRQWGMSDLAAAEDDVARQLQKGDLSDDELDLGARLAMQEGRYEQARDLFTKLILRRPDNASAIASRGYAYDELDDDETAFGEYRLAIGLNPELGLTYIDLARLSKLRGSHAEAAAFLDRALELLPASAHVHEALAMNLVDRGKMAAVSGRNDEARQLLLEGEQAARKSIQLDSERPWAYLNLGASLSEQARISESEPGALRQAVEAYDTALEIMEDPDRRPDPSARAFLLANTCDARIGLRDLGQALDLCREVTRLLPQDPVAYYNLGGVYALLGRTDEALDALEKDAELGDADWEYLLGDPWFESVRDDPRFKEVVSRMKAASAALAG